MNEIKGISRLTKEDEARLRDRLADGEPEALSDLVRSHLGFVVKVAMEYQGLGLPLEDLLSEGNVGLIEAARRYDIERGTRFTTYAIWWIRKSILGAISGKAAMIRAPVARVRRIRQVREAEEELHRSLGRKPSREEVSRHLSTTIKEIDKLLRQRATVVSMEQEIGEGSSATLERRLRDRHAVNPEQRLLSRERRGMLTDAMSRLPERERLVIERRFGLTGERGETLNDIAASIGLSRERVRQIESQARVRLRKLIQRLGASLPVTPTPASPGRGARPAAGRECRSPRDRNAS